MMLFSECERTWKKYRVIQDTISHQFYERAALKNGESKHEHVSRIALYEH